LTNKKINVLFIADIIGKPGLIIIKQVVKQLREQYQVDLCIANGENGSAGKGLTAGIAQEYFNNGIDVITSGNHIFEKYGVHKLLNTNHKIIRPLDHQW